MAKLMTATEIATIRAHRARLIADAQHADRRWSAYCLASARCADPAARDELRAMARDFYLKTSRLTVKARKLPLT